MNETEESLKTEEQVKARFRNRRSVIDENRRRQFEALGGTAIPHADHQLILEDLLSMSIRRHGRPYPMLKLQGEMLIDLVEAEKAVSFYKKSVADLEERKAPEEEIRYVKSEWFKYQRLRTALRDIGDGIAWRLMEFDRCALTQMGIRPRKQHINIEGTTQELAELANIINERNQVAILNDLTHILKKGDVTAKLTDGEFEFVEVKSSNSKGSRMIRQRNDLEETISFLNDGEKVQEGQLLRIQTFSAEPQSYMKHMERAFDRAQKDSVVVEKIGEHLAFHITDFESADHLIDPEPSFEKFGSIFDEWTERGDVVFDFSSADRYAHVQNFAPFSLFPIAHKHRVKLMTTALLVGAHLNVSAVLRYLSGRGWTTIKGPKEFAKEFDENNPQELPVAAVRKGSLTIHLPMPLVGRLAHEYLSLRSFGDILDCIFKAGRPSADGLFINLLGESKQWD